MAIVEFIGMTVLAIVIVAAVTVVLINDRNARCRETINNKSESRDLDRRRKRICNHLEGKGS